MRPKIARPLACAEVRKPGTPATRTGRRALGSVCMRCSHSVESALGSNAVCTSPLHVNETNPGEVDRLERPLCEESSQMLLQARFKESNTHLRGTYPPSAHCSQSPISGCQLRIPRRVSLQLWTRRRVLKSPRLGRHRGSTRLYEVLLRLEGTGNLQLPLSCRCVAACNGERRPTHRSRQTIWDDCWELGKCEEW